MAPEEISNLLSTDIDIVADPTRSTMRDLWPCIWALASVLERQFSGKINIDCGLTTPLPAPSSLSERCRFSRASEPAPLRIYLGVAPPSSDAILGDTRGSVIAYDQLLDGTEMANPIACFGLAGYLGFASLARTIGIPTYRTEYCTNRLNLPARTPDGDVPHVSISMIGLGQLGQAYLALLYFLTRSAKAAPSVVLIDKDFFELPNRHTQVLLNESEDWNGCRKTDYLERHVKRWGWEVKGLTTELTWSWKRPAGDPGLAMLGLDDLDVRRMAIAAGYDWIIDAGLGTSFVQPRLSWHSLPPDNTLARTIFSVPQRAVSLDFLEGTPLHRQLVETPGQCGWVTFQGVTAAAPSMGIAAAAYAITELLSVLDGSRLPLEGRACLWSPLLPYTRTEITATS
jgi:hypothetical protein